MNRIVVSIGGALAMLAATAAYAQTQAPDVQGTLRKPEVLPAPFHQPVGPPPAVFSIGGLPVSVWAPVPPHYNALANRNGAANPLIKPDWWPSLLTSG